MTARTAPIRPRQTPAASVVAVTVAALGWTALALAAFADLLPSRAELIALCFPAVLGSWLLLRRVDPHPAVVRLVFSTGLVSLAVVSAQVIASNPKLALAVPLLAALGALARRRPAVVTVAVFALGGTYNTLAAYSAISVELTADLLLAGLWAAVLLAHLTRASRGRFELPVGVVLLVIYVVLTVVGAILFEDTNVSYYGARVTVWYATALLVIAYAPWSAASYQRLLRGVIAVVALVAGYAILRLVIGPGEAEQRLARLYTGDLIFQDGELRLFGSFPGRHWLGAWTATAIPFCVGASLALRGGWRVCSIAAAALATIAMFGSDMRTALAAVIVAGTAMIVLYQIARGFPGPRIGATAIGLVVAVGLVGGSFLLVTEGTESRLQRYAALVDPRSDPSIQQRTFKWEQVLADTSDHPFGHGVGTAGVQSGLRNQFVTFEDVYIDNAYLTIAYEQGLALLALFALALLMLLVAAIRRAVQASDPWEAGIGIASTGTILAFAVLLVTGPYLQGLTALATWLLIGVSFAPLVQRIGPSNPADVSR